MAEVEQASLRSEQLSDKSSSPALPDDLSLDERTAFRLLTPESTVSGSVVARARPCPETSMCELRAPNLSLSLHFFFGGGGYR